MKHFDILAYILLFLVLGIGAAVFYQVRFNPAKQFLVVILLSSFYLFWGILYHYQRRDLSRKLFLEYLLIAAIAAAVGFLVFME